MKIILLSGTLCNEALWQYQLNFFSKFSDIDMEVFDITTQNSIEEMADELLDTAPKQFCLAAFSLGTLVAFDILRKKPERILKLALFSTSCGGPTPGALRSLCNAIQAIEKNGLNDFLESAYNRYVHPSRLDDLCLKKIYMDMAQSLGVSVALRQITAILNWKRFTEFDKILCPTLLVCGATDTQTTTPKMHQHLAKRIPHATLVVIEKSGHLTLLEQPKPVNAAMTVWLGLTTPEWTLT